MDGLRRYGYGADADRVARKFIALVTKEFEEHGTIVETGRWNDLVAGQGALSRLAAAAH